jgi:hypothetical protein
MRATVALYWIPLGAGGHSVRFNGRVYEAIAAALERRPRRDLYHAALIVAVDGRRHAIELAPVPDADGAARGVVATGPVGLRALGRARLFRYELRCRRDGTIPDLGYAVGGPRTITTDPAAARRVLALAPAVPTPVWGRDELGAGEGWNSNSVIAWLLARAGLGPERCAPPPGGRAPGWAAGIAVARRGGPGTSVAGRDPAPVGGADRRLGGGEPRDRHPVGRAGDVVEPGHVEELDRVGIAAVLAADPELE